MQSRRTFLTRSIPGAFALDAAGRNLAQSSPPVPAPNTPDTTSPAPSAPPARPPALAFSADHKLADMCMRDACILDEPEKQTYTFFASVWRGGVRAFANKDLVAWEGPHTIFQTPENFRPGCVMRGIREPELHRHRGKYYLSPSTRPRRSPSNGATGFRVCGAPHRSASAILRLGRSRPSRRARPCPSASAFSK